MFRVVLLDDDMSGALAAVGRTVSRTDPETLIATAGAHLAARDS